MQRRDFLRMTGALVISARACGLRADDSSRTQVMTVTGLVDAEAVGTTLPHEHVMVDFIGADAVSQERYDPDRVFESVLPQLNLARQQGCRTLIECTSHDAGWYSVGAPSGGNFRPYTTLFEQFLPALEAAGFGDEELHLLTVKNPAEAFAIRVRRR